MTIIQEYDSMLTIPVTLPFSPYFTPNIITVVTTKTFSTITKYGLTGKLIISFSKKALLTIQTHDKSIDIIIAA